MLPIIPEWEEKEKKSKKKIATTFWMKAYGKPVPPNQKSLKKKIKVLYDYLQCKA